MASPYRSAGVMTILGHEVRLSLQRPILWVGLAVTLLYGLAQTWRPGHTALTFGLELATWYIFIQWLVLGAAWARAWSNLDHLKLRELVSGTPFAPWAYWAVRVGAAWASVALLVAGASLVAALAGIAAGLGPGAAVGAGTIFAAAALPPMLLVVTLASGLDASTRSPMVALVGVSLIWAVCAFGFSTGRAPTYLPLLGVGHVSPLDGLGAWGPWYWLSRGWVMFLAALLAWGGALVVHKQPRLAGFSWPGAGLTLGVIAAVAALSLGTARAVPTLSAARENDVAAVRSWVRHSSRDDWLRGRLALEKPHLRTNVYVHDTHSGQAERLAVLVRQVAEHVPPLGGKELDIVEVPWLPDAQWVGSTLFLPETAVGKPERVLIRMMVAAVPVPSGPEDSALLPGEEPGPIACVRLLTEWSVLYDRGEPLEAELERWRIIAGDGENQGSSQGEMDALYSLAAMGARRPVSRETVRRALETWSSWEGQPLHRELEGLWMSASEATPGED